MSLDQPSLEEQQELEKVRHEVEDLEYGGRHEGAAKWAAPVIAAAWSLFQLSLPYLITLDSAYVRAIHLGFAVALVYVCFPAFRKWQPTLPGFRWLGQRSATPVVDILLAIVAAAAATYVAWEYEALVQRAGDPLLRDMVVGLSLILLLLEATRRALGPALPIVASAFILYAFFAEYMPDVLAFKARSLRRIVEQLALSTEGIYGVPLYVSASTVFLFVLFGAALEKTGGGDYFVRLAFAALGRYKGGPAKAAVLASGLTGMVSGSSIANVVTTGTFTIPLMKKGGYPGEKAAAVEVAASTNAQFMPPIMGAAAFIMAEYCNVPYLEVVRAAFIPAFLSYIGLLIITHLEASKLGLSGLPKADLPHFFRTLRGGLHFLVPLALLLYLLIIRRYSPELSAFWSFLMLFVAVAIHHLLTLGVPGLRLAAHELWESLVAGGKNMMGIGVAVAAAGIIVGIVSLGPGERITDVVAHLAGDSIWAILLLTAVASLLLGMGLPTTANYIVMASLTAPVIVALAADTGYVVPLLAAHLFVFYFGILADDTPPVGLAAYAGAAIARTDPIRTGLQSFTYDMRTAILPFMFFFNTELLLMGVDTWSYGFVVFLSGLTGMAAFAFITQNWMFMRLNWFERIALIIGALIMLQPLFFERIVPVEALPSLQWFPWGNRWVWRAMGLAAVLVAVASQWRRQPRADMPSYET